MNGVNSMSLNIKICKERDHDFIVTYNRMGKCYRCKKCTLERNKF